MTKQIPMRKAVFIIGVIVSGAFVTMLNQSILTPAIPSIMAEMNVSANTAQWLTTVFLLVAAVMIPLTAYFINKFPTRLLFMGAMSSFCLGSLLCATSRSFAVVLAGRVFQAMGAGTMMPLCQTVTMLLMPVNKRGTANGIIGLVMALAPAVGPTLSGWMISVATWHIMFYVIALLSLVDIVFAFFVLENAVDTSNPTLDIPSVILSTLALVLFLYGCSMAGDVGLHQPLPWAFMLSGIAVAAVFVRRQLTLPQPFLELRVLKHREFAIATIIAMITNACLVSGTVLMPIFMQNIQGLTAMQSGLMMLPGAICMAILNVVSGYVFDHQGPRKLCLAGLAMLVFSSLNFMTLDVGSSFFHISFIYTFRMVGISLTMMPVTTWGLNHLANEVLPHGTAINNTLRQVAGSIGTSLFVAILTSCASLRQTAGEAEIAANLYGMHVTFFAISVCAITAMALCLIFVKQPKPDGVVKIKKNAAA